MEQSGMSLGRRVVIALVAVGVGVVMWLIARAVVPRWWAQRIADIVDGRLTTGALFGLFVGGVFTAVPLAIIAGSTRRRSSKRTWIGWVVWVAVAVVIALPNWMTLGIVTGTGNAAHAGERILDVSAPGFRMWSLIGAIVGAVVVGWVAFLSYSRRRARRRLAHKDAPSETTSDD